MTTATFKDVMKRDLKDFSITPESWTLLSKDRPNWRSRLHGGRRIDTTANLQKLREKAPLVQQMINLKKPTIVIRDKRMPTHTGINLVPLSYQLYKIRVLPAKIKLSAIWVEIIFCQQQKKKRNKS